MALRTAYIVSLLAALGGCVTIAANTPGDLAFASVRLTDGRDQPELPGPGASPLRGLVSDRDLLHIGESLTGGEKAPRPTLRIEFTSATNLARFAAENSWNVGSSAFFCGRQETYSDLSYPYVFWRGTKLHWLEPDQIGTALGSGPGSRVAYYFFLDVARERQVPANPPVEAYDLRRAPEDVCFHIRGGNTHVGRGYRSNVVRVPKEAIAVALGGPAPGVGRP